MVSPYLVKTYSLELSQVLVAAMLSWTLFFVLGEKRKTWHLVVGGLLAGMAMMTRLNMAPLLPFMLLYILWQYGWRKALATGTAGGMVVLVLHAIYWPGILRMWAYWIPQGIFSFLDPYYEPWRKTFAFHPRPISEWIGNIQSVQWNPVIAFWQGMRFYFPGLTAAFATMLLWPKRRKWSTDLRFRQTPEVTVGMTTAGNRGFSVCRIRYNASLPDRGKVYSGDLCRRCLYRGEKNVGNNGGEGGS